MPLVLRQRVDRVSVCASSHGRRTCHCHGHPRVGRKPHGRILPKILRSAGGVPIFVPSIPKICDAVLDQLRYRITHADNFQSNTGNYHLRYLERQSQRDLLLPLWAQRNRAGMEQRMNSFKRKPTLAMIQESMRKTSI